MAEGVKVVAFFGAAEEEETHDVPILVKEGDEGLGDGEKIGGGVV